MRFGRVFLRFGRPRGREGGVGSGLSVLPGGRRSDIFLKPKKKFFDLGPLRLKSAKKQLKTVVRISS